MLESEQQLLLALAYLWRTRPQPNEDDDGAGTMAHVDGRSGRLVTLAWVASNDDGFAAFVCSTVNIGSAKFRATFVWVGQKVCQIGFGGPPTVKVVFFIVLDPLETTSTRINPVVPDLVLSHSVGGFVIKLTNLPKLTN